MAWRTSAELFLNLMWTPESLPHLFFAERAASKFQTCLLTPPKRDIQKWKA